MKPCVIIPQPRCDRGHGGSFLEDVKRSGGWDTLHPQWRKYSEEIYQKQVRTRDKAVEKEKKAAADAELKSFLVSAGAYETEDEAVENYKANLVDREATEQELNAVRAKWKAQRPAIEKQLRTETNRIAAANRINPAASMATEDLESLVGDPNVDQGKLKRTAGSKQTTVEGHLREIVSAGKLLDAQIAASQAKLKEADGDDPAEQEQLSPTWRLPMQNPASQHGWPQATTARWATWRATA